MSSVTPPAEGDAAVVAGPDDLWTLPLLRAAWPIHVTLLLLVTVLVLFATPDRMSAWITALAILGPLVVAEGAAAFGGPAVKRAQELRASVGSTNGAGR